MKTGHQLNFMPPSQYEQVVVNFGDKSSCFILKDLFLLYNQVFLLWKTLFSLEMLFIFSEQNAYKVGSAIKSSKTMSLDTMINQKLSQKDARSKMTSETTEACNFLLNWLGDSVSAPACLHIWHVLHATRFGSGSHLRLKARQSSLLVSIPKPDPPTRRHWQAAMPLPHVAMLGE